MFHRPSLIIPTLILGTAMPMAGADGEPATLTRAREQAERELQAASEAYARAAEASRGRLVRAYESAIRSAETGRKTDLAAALRTELETLRAQPLTPKPPRPLGHVALIQAIGEDTVGADGQRRPAAELGRAEFVVLYFSASWCGPCKAFTPKLIEKYPALAKDGRVEVLLVGSDRDEASQAAYMKEYPMPWRAVPFARVEASGLKAKHGGRGIPNVVVLDAQGTVVAQSYVEGKYQGPMAPIEALEARLAAKAR